MVTMTTIPRTRVRVPNAGGRTSIVGRIPQDQLRVIVRPETFAERLRRLRRERGWSLDDLAAQSALSKATIGMIEQGHSTWPTAHTIAALARGLQMTMDALWNGEEGS